jgi:DNA-binding transcriptional ArsR family regulator
VGSVTTAETSRVEQLRARAELCRVLTDPKRLLILDALRDGERSVGELADELGCALPNVSQHLSLLRNAGLVERRREGTTVHYRLAAPRILDACEIVGEIVARADSTPTRRPA